MRLDSSADFDLAFVNSAANLTFSVHREQSVSGTGTVWGRHISWEILFVLTSTDIWMAIEASLQLQIIIQLLNALIQVSQGKQHNGQRKKLVGTKHYRGASEFLICIVPNICCLQNCCKLAHIHWNFLLARKKNH